MTASRVFTILAAVALVTSFALATLMPPMLPLGEAILELDRHILAIMREAVTTHISAAAWTDVASPCLERPAWLPPAMLGIIFGGLALSTRPNRPSPKRRRSN